VIRHQLNPLSRIIINGLGGFSHLHIAVYLCNIVLYKVIQ